MHSSSLHITESCSLHDGGVYILQHRARRRTHDNTSVRVESLAEVGNKVLQEQGGNMEDKRMGFHYPPFNTVDHLCLHVLSPASQMSFLSSTIYSTTFWFMTVEKILEKLEAMPPGQ
ncbi:adenosine 5'-monophosphoramidase HINT3-like isoform X2 [Branchiostoma floridae x Branchiostoma belcheri]